MENPIPQNERDRLTALEGYGVIDTPPEVDFDDIAVMAGQGKSCLIARI